MKSRSKREKRDGMPGVPLEQRRPIAGYTLAMTIGLLIAVAAAVLAYLLPPLQVIDPPRVVNSVDPAGGRVYDLLPAGAPYGNLSLFNYPGKGYLPHVPRPSITIATVKQTGLLQAYSVPPRSVAFVQGGLAQFVPPPPMPLGPRVAGLVSHGNPSVKRIALTFDDGYSGFGSLVDLLTKLRVPATLFPAGNVDAASPSIVRKAEMRGFELGNHTYNHPITTLLPPWQLVIELNATSEAVKKACGTGTVAYFRPPYGTENASVQYTAGQLGYLTVTWDRDTLDWSPTTTPEQLISRATDGVQGGEIVLMHSQGQYTQQLLPQIVKILRDKGFELTTVTGLLQP